VSVLHPPVEPHETGTLDVGDGHSLYWEVSGNPDGKPAVVLHGGPGSGSSPGLRRYFDPARYRIVLFDRRNSRRSTPPATGPHVDLSTCRQHDPAPGGRRGAAPRAPRRPRPHRHPLLGGFLPDGQLLREAGRLVGIPGVMVHGRFDVSGPLDTAWAMHGAWPDSELVVIGDAGHVGGGMGETLLTATDRFADRR
jgi:pimeloyl-ACP methyl ester carboxylesterase